jgi:NADPH2:quinone reductase
MKAMVCKAFGPIDSLVFEDFPEPKCGPGEVRVAVKAAGCNFPDILQIEGKYQFKPPFPFVPGMESAGDVLEVGAGVSGFKVGQRVITRGGSGTFAGQTVAPARDVLAMPDNMSYEHGAAFPVTYGTTYHALVQRGELKKGEVLMVHGASGGVGLTAVELGKLMGATVIATGGNDEKLQIAKQYGADHLINYSREKIRDRVKDITGGKGADVIYDPVGGDAMDESIRSINWNGRILVIGFASGRIAEVPTNYMLLKGASLVGVFWGQFTQKEPELNAENFRALLKLYGEGKLKPHVSMRLPLADAKKALHALADRKATGKVVLTA